MRKGEAWNGVRNGLRVEAQEREGGRKILALLFHKARGTLG